MNAKILVLSVILFSLFSISSAKATTDTTGGSTTNSPFNSAVQLVQVTASANGFLQSLGMNMSSCGSGGNIEAALYSDNSNVPNALIAQTSPTACAVGWNDMTATSVAITQSTKYWIAVQSSNNQPSIWLATTSSYIYSPYANYPTFPVNCANCTGNAVADSTRMTYGPLAAMGSTIVIASPGNATYQLSDCLNMSFSYGAYGNTTFSLYAANDGNILYNNAAYPNSTSIVNITTGDINITNNFTVQTNDAGTINTTSILFTCLPAQPAQASDYISLFFSNPAVLSIIVILVFNIAWVGTVAIGSKGNKKIPTRLFLVSCFIWAAMFVSFSILDGAYIMVFIFVIAALITYMYQKIFTEGMHSYIQGFIAYFVFFTAFILFEGMAALTNPAIFGINASNSALFTNSCTDTNLSWVINIIPNHPYTLFTLSGNPVIDSINCAHVYVDQFSVLWSLNSWPGIVNDLLISSFLLFMVLYTADFIRGRTS